MRNARFALITAAATLGVAGTAVLGCWQWGRAQQKLDAQAAIVAREALPAIDARELPAVADPSSLLHRRVRLRGTWVAQHTVFLDNRQMQAKQGFYVVTPLRIEGADAAIAVQRGWVPRNFERREQLPAVQTPAAPVEIEGRLAPPPARLYAFAETEQGSIRQNLDLAGWRDETRLPLLAGLSVQQLGPASEGLLRAWPEAGAGAEKNRGYAFQWWALSALIAILYVWFQFIRPRTAP
jgi:surfeit locus 1 family protein